jgi:CDP-diacylglycerol--serine O-phosphatidyltransferase
MRAKRRDRAVPLKRLIPNMLTAAALCCGLASVHFAIEQNFERAVIALLIAAIFDALDGRVARILHATSPFGAVLDSLSDFLSFGVAPMIVLHQMFLKGTDVLGLAAVLTYALCAALRLARFTAEVAKPPSHPGLSAYFTGMPTPAAGGIVLIPVMLAVSPVLGNRGWGQTPDWAVIALTLAIALLMVSRVPLFSVKKLRVPRRGMILFFASIALVLAAAFKDVYLTLAVIAIAYLALLPVSVLSHRKLRAKILAEAKNLAGGDPKTGSDVHSEPGASAPLKTDSGAA